MKENEQALNKFFGVTFQRLIKNEKLAVEKIKKYEESFNETEHGKQLHAEMWTSCCFSISQSLRDSQIYAQSFEKRSEFFYHIKKYNAALHDIEIALKSVELSELKIELHCRKVMCLVALGKKIDYSLTEAESELKNIKNRRQKQYFKFLIDDAQAALKNHAEKICEESKDLKNLELLNGMEKEDFSNFVTIR